MKLSDSKIIKSLNFLATLVLVFYAIFFVSKLCTSGAPSLSNSVKSYTMSNVIAEQKDHQLTKTLDKWFNDQTIVQPVNKAKIDLRFKSYSELLHFPAVLFQISQFMYWLLIGFLILCIKLLFSSFNKNEVFTNKNASIILFGALTLIWLPIIGWVTQELFINCIAKLNLNDSGFSLKNGAHLFASETLIGLALMAFGLAFKAGVNIKQENESFI